MTIQTIINNAIKRLKAEGKLLTPDFYAEAFCKEAERSKMSVEDCNHLEKFKKMLGKDFQKDLKNYRIKTMSEFVRFLISKLNRTSSSQCADVLEAQTLLCKRALQVIRVLHNKEASELAKKSIELLENSPSPEDLENFRQRWVNFITTYDDTFLQKLKSLGDIDSSDLRKSIENLHISEDTAASTSMQVVDLKRISRVLVASFVPSIASSVNDTIATISEKIKKNPKVLDSAEIEKEIKSAISLRIALDKESVKEMVESIDGVLDKLSLRLIDMIESSDNSNAEIQAIKRELESYSEESANFKVTHKKLFTIAVALEENTELLSRDLKCHNKDVEVLSQKVKKLEAELEKAKKESKEDFLTKLYNKRALDEFLELKEAEYQRYERNYSVVMFDLDHFKKVNDTYGHEAGDAVLAAFGKILKKEARSVDVVGRFGGEEFLALLSDTSVEGGVTFAKKVLKHVQNARFMYQKQRIKVTSSAGVSERAHHISLEATINSADEYLYLAKKNGRNRVEYKR